MLGKGLAKQLIGKPETLHSLYSAVLIAVLETDYEQAARFGAEAIKVWKKLFNKKKGFPRAWQMFFYGLALYKTDETKFHSFAEEFSAFSLKTYPDFTVPRAVSALAYFLKNSDILAQTAAAQLGLEKFPERFISVILSALLPSLKLPNYAQKFVAANKVCDRKYNNKYFMQKHVVFVINSYFCYVFVIVNCNCFPTIPTKTH